MWRITVVFSDGAGRWALSSRTRYCYSDWLLLRLHATTSHCLRTTRWILVSGGSQHSKLLDFATNRVRTQSRCFVALRQSHKRTRKAVTRGRTDHSATYLQFPVQICFSADHAFMIILCYSLFVYLCFCCVEFSFFSVMPKDRDWSGRTSPKWPILCRVRRKTLTQSISACEFLSFTQLDYGGQVDVIYTDFAKAFDTVPHRRLLRADCTNST